VVDVCEVYEDEPPQEPRKPKPKPGLEPDLKRNVRSSSTKVPEQKRRQSDVVTT
jgi:hypothetical protein